MGEVWLAEQTQPIRRQVALKVIKAGMDSAQVIARFEAERQALALMDHPAIATVFDGGTTPQGRPYFVMEYVKGEPVTAYCDRHRLSTAERLELFTQVCEGVQHAHQKGVIHRDLKPSNVLVSIRDDRPVPKIIDFGVAKATTQYLTERSLFTELGVLIGTPEYMSPEQAEMGSLDIDTRTDVYALGVLLYELLTGALPFERKDLWQSGLAGIQRIIREKEPPRPSTRITRIGPASTEAAKNRHTEPRRLVNELRGDLDWITMRALAKDRTRRYQTANALAADVRRHLNNEPVSAGPPSAAYRANKFVQRHRFGVAAATVLVLLLVAFGVTMAVQAQRIARERDRAEAEANKAAAVSQFLQETLGAADPWQSGRDQSVREVLTIAAAKVEASFKGEPLVGAAVRRAIGLTYSGLGRYGEAEPLLRSALQIRTAELGPDHPEVAESLGDLSELQERLSRYDESVRLARQALAIQQRAKDKAPAPTVRALRRLGVALFHAGEYAESERLLRDALQLQQEVRAGGEIERANVLGDLSQTVGSGLQDAAAAEKMLREALDLRRTKLGSDHPQTAMALNDLAVTRLQQEDYKEAEALYREALVADEKSLGKEHPETAAALENLGGVLFKTKRYDEALAVLDRVLAVRKKGLGEDSLQVVRTLHNIAVVQTNAGRLAQAEAAFAEVLPRMKALLGADHPEVAQVLASWAKLKVAEKDYEAGERLSRQSLDIRLAKLGEDHLTVAAGRVSLASVLVLEGRFAEAEALLKKAQEVQERALGKDAVPTRESASELQKLYAAWGRPQP
jgi:eukaryotic-like serine/threonine-protein kinase